MQCLCPSDDYTPFNLPSRDLSLFLKTRFGDHRLLLSTQSDRHSALKYTAFGALDIIEYTYGAPSTIQVAGLKDSYHLQIIREGECHWHAREERFSFKSGDAILIAPGEAYSLTQSADCVKLIVKIPAHFMQTTAREFGHIVRDPNIRFTKRGLESCQGDPIGNLVHNMLGQASRSGPERVVVYYSKLLCQEILERYQSRTCSWRKHTTTSHRLIEIIRNHILDNIDSDISIGALAQLCNISRKSLYNLFGRELGQTPASYIRQLKLEQIHTELSTNPERYNITEIALQYGFTNLGRFSAQYRSIVGELPSETRQRLRSESAPALYQPAPNGR